MQTCYAKWLSICSKYYEFHALVHMHCVEWNCHNFFSFLFVVFLLIPVLFVLLYIVNKDEYNTICCSVGGQLVKGTRHEIRVTPCSGTI